MTTALLCCDILVPSMGLMLLLPQGTETHLLGHISEALSG